MCSGVSNVMVLDYNPHRPIVHSCRLLLLANAITSANSVLVRSQTDANRERRLITQMVSAPVLETTMLGINTRTKQGLLLHCPQIHKMLRHSPPSIFSIFSLDY